jgi:hypothetical protein
MQYLEKWLPLRFIYPLYVLMKQGVQKEGTWLEDENLSLIASQYIYTGATATYTPGPKK